MKKEDYDFNGERRLLGREISNHEFKGYMVAEIKNIKDIIAELKPRIAQNERMLWGGLGAVTFLLIILQIF